MSAKCLECRQTGLHASTCSYYTPTIGDKLKIFIQNDKEAIVSTEIKLFHFVDWERNELLEFGEYWSAKNKTDPEIYPMKMNHEDWIEQFSIFIEQFSIFVEGKKLCPNCNIENGHHNWDCPSGGLAATISKQSEKPVTGLQGWICPVCGAGNSPFTNTCPCKPLYTKFGD